MMDGSREKLSQDKIGRDTSSLALYASTKEHPCEDLSRKMTLKGNLIMLELCLELPAPEHGE